MDSISDALATYLLSGIDGFATEDLIVELLEIRHGIKFESMGGRKDGGADGRFTGVYSQDAGHFVQISREGTIERKIERTIDRLREVGRDVAAVTYWTHIDAPRRDIVEETVSKNKSVLVRIRDRSSLSKLINESKETKTLFRLKFKAQLDELIAQSNIPSAVSQFSKDPTVYAYLKFEAGERNQRTDVLLPVVDALIYWSLRETDPEKVGADGHPLLLSRVLLKKKIAEALPGAKNMVEPRIDARLASLCKKDHAGNQRVRFYAESDSFCLPFEMRAALAEEGAEDAELTDSVLDSLRERAVEAGADAEKDIVARVTMDVVYRHFYEQGLVLAAFLEKRLETITTEDQILEVELNKSLDQEVVSRLCYGAALKVLRGFFYIPNDAEKKFQKRLSRTSLLLVSLKHSPQLLEYFNGMTGRFRLLVGTDILVKALSEVCLLEESQTVTNLLRVAHEAGATLALSEPVLEELFTHVVAANQEFKNHYAAREGFINNAVAGQSARILIRAYFHAKSAGKVKSWGQFINIFVDFDSLNSNSVNASAQLGAFLSKRFGMQYLSRIELSHGVDSSEKEALTQHLLKRHPDKKSALAQNDALMALAVYAQRRLRSETMKYDGFGLATWWLTKETLILAYTGDYVKAAGAPYVMRPEFLLNFLSLAPNIKLSERGRQLLPTHVGLQLGQHLSDSQMERLLGAVEEWGNLPQERVDIRMSEFADRLKYDRLKQYGSNVELDSDDLFKVGIARLKSDLASDAKTG